MTATAAPPRVSTGEGRRRVWAVRLVSATTVVCGAVLVAVGVGLLPHLVKSGVSFMSVLGLVSVVAGVALVWSGAASVAGRSRPARIATVIAALLGVALVVWTVAPAVAATHVPATALGDDPSSRGLAFESLTTTTDDGVTLAAWYLPSRTGAAVVLLHGAGSTRSDVLDQAAVLADHGIGVLMLDARGHGASDGRAMDFGWFGDLDVRAGVDVLVARPDVDASRIGVVGMSMGGEEAIGAAGSDDRIAAVVAEGATARIAGDEEWLSDRYGVRGSVQEGIEVVQDRVTELLSDAPTPIALRTAVARSDAEVLLITAGRLADERFAAEHVRGAAPGRVEVWTVEGAGHTDGLRTAPAEWERRVVGFLEAQLGG